MRVLRIAFRHKSDTSFFSEPLLHKGYTDNIMYFHNAFGGVSDLQIPEMPFYFFAREFGRGAREFDGAAGEFMEMPISLFFPAREFPGNHKRLFFPARGHQKHVGRLTNVASKFLLCALRLTNAGRELANTAIVFPVPSLRLTNYTTKFYGHICQP